MASAAAPTPGKITWLAARMASGFDVSVFLTCSRCSANRSDAIFAPPLSMIATLSAAMSGQGAFCRRCIAALEANRLSQRASHRLEAGFNHVMCIFAGNFNMKRRSQCFGQRLKEMWHEFCWQATNCFSGKVSGEREIAAA